MKPFTITVGIPAYNEEANIAFLLEDILSQEEAGFSLEKILVYSDGSSDGTNDIVRSISDPRIELIIGPGRLGQAVGQNAISDRTQSDCLVLINADMHIPSKKFLSEISAPVANESVDLVSSGLLPLPPRTFMESVLVVGFLLKNILFESFASGQGIYTCHGAARAFSRRLYQSLRFPRSVGEDAYSYLFCRYRGYAYRYVSHAVIELRLPDNFRDHAKQSLRFSSGRRDFLDEFPEDFVRQETSIPVRAFIVGFLRALPTVFLNPIRSLFFVGTVFFMRFLAMFPRKVSDVWDISVTSKQVR